MRITQVDSLPVQYVSHDSNVEKRVFLKYGEVPHLSQFATATLKPGEQATLHHHDDMTETFHFLSGKAEVEVDGKVHLATAGTTVTVFPKEAHEIRNNGTEDVIMVYFGIVD
ncbi:hypothetical protein DFQ27_002860 [Actinomortierella ambigua]|uniref:Cupin type-2 domain-containing protein n=1 Tax=Actinomortierella ambigua TaxID=1343610 RepID=A0A9P6U6P8_9FUNG|nr:hypothetical protein DFQ26_009047 [Actinomortierella ambigua]KAG0261625.1 hypothetical protein DFQ27_002860 [Actinomortierella ambigua]